jgi:hypothetical protein
MSRASSSIFTNGEPTETIDALGRRLTVRQPNALDQLRLFKAVGPLLAQNQPYLGMAMVACSVTAIDSVPVPIPGNEHQIESLVQRLGDAGLRAAGALLEPPASDDDIRNQAGN